MSLPIDRTAKSTLDANLINGITSDAPTLKASDDIVYNTIDELYNYASGLVAGGVLQPYPAFLSRQSLINGNFDVAQRGTSFANPADGSYSLDRWKTRFNVDGGTGPTITHSRLQLTSGDVSSSYFGYRINSTGAGASLGVNSFCGIQQNIENGSRYLCGVGKKITVSFWAKSDISGKKIGVLLQQNYGGGGSPSAQETINGTKWSLTSTWAKYSFTFTTNTLVGKTFGTNNDDSLILQIRNVWGSSVASLVGDTVAETFVGSGNIDITQVQVNAGDQALPFQPKSFAEELQLCQRYYEKSYSYADAPGTVTSFGGVLYQTRTAIGASTAGTLYSGDVNFKVRKRTTPTMTLYSNSGTANAIRKNTATVRTGATTLQQSERGFSQISLDNTSATSISLDDIIDFQWTSDAEL